MALADMFFASGPFSCFLEEDLGKEGVQTSWIRSRRFSSRDSGVCLEEGRAVSSVRVLLASALGMSSWIKGIQFSSDAD